MILTTTREKGDKVFVLYKDQILQLEISQIVVFYGDNSSNKSDSIRENFGLIDKDGAYVTTARAEKCFTTKQELIESL